MVVGHGSSWYGGVKSGGMGYGDVGYCGVGVWSYFVL